MLDLSRESVEYVCTRFRSPHIARKYGHKIYSDYQDPFLEALRIRASTRIMVRNIYIHKRWDYNVHMILFFRNFCHSKNCTLYLESILGWWVSRRWDTSIITSSCQTWEKNKHWHQQLIISSTDWESGEETGRVLAEWRVSKIQQLFITFHCRHQKQRFDKKGSLHLIKYSCLT